MHHLHRTSCEHLPHRLAQDPTPVRSSHRLLGSDLSQREHCNLMRPLQHSLMRSCVQQSASMPAAHQDCPEEDGKHRAHAHVEGDHDEDEGCPFLQYRSILTLSSVIGIFRLVCDSIQCLGWKH